jgi:hypothetical protein
MVFAERVLASSRSLPKTDIHSGQQTGSKRPKAASPSYAESKPERPAKPHE